MLKDRDLPIIGFVWRANEINSTVVEVARRTSTKALFDLSSIELDSASMALVKADIGGAHAGVKIDPEALFSSELDDLLEDTGITRIWVELPPPLLKKEPKAYLDRIAQMPDELSVIPIISNVELINKAVKDYPQIRNIAIKGSEAAGFVSSENTFTLYEAVRKTVEGPEDPPGIMVWGGMATPQAAAAFLSVGARGIVFESLHWMTDLVTIGDELRDRISKLRPEHTDLVGLNLHVPCRLFNKGNSKAVKSLREFAGSLCGAEVTAEQQKSFAQRIAQDSMNPLDSGFTKEELLPIGVEAAFCNSFVRKYGASTEEAVDRFVSDIESHCALADAKLNAFVQSPVAQEMGITYPFVQGAMSWISDMPEFAAKVAKAGGLPTVALGLMSGSLLDTQLGRLAGVMGDKPYAVNVITLQENPCRDEQLAWIKSTSPKFAVIAAGEPSHAQELLEAGIEVIYIAPNEELLRLAFEAGVRFVVCEGNEAGGHVGEHSTLTIAQTVLDLKEREPGLFEGRRVILAGGICSRQTAFMAAMLGADAVQLGTSYLATREIVETGALTELYQRMILEAKPGSTTITGEGTGLRVRSLSSPRIEAICTLERDFASGSESESSFRHKIEELSAGSLFIAARGLDKPGGSPLNEQACVEKGQFMSGACAGVVNNTTTVAELHRELAEGQLVKGLPFTGPVRETHARVGAGSAQTARIAATAVGPIPQAPVRDRIAITGMSVVNSLGNSLEEIWTSSLALKSGIVEVPPTKWDHSMFFDPKPQTQEKTYCKWGAFQNIEITRKELGIPPQDFRTMTDSTKVTMWLAQKAIEQSGILSSDIPRERIAVLISQNSGEAAATLQDVIIRGASSKLVNSIKAAVPLTAESEKAVEDAVKAGRIAIDDTTLLGRLNCAAAGFICNRYGFNGPSFAVSAACATALVALYSAYQMIRNGVIDAAVIGGAEESLTPMHFLEFAALGALAGLSGVDKLPHEASRPFDNDRDGMVLGEGGGMIVIERESVAAKRGAEVHAYITSMGASNNHLGMVESSKETQQLAIGASFNDAPYGPDTVDLIECHATSTQQGDVEEVLALKRFFNSGKRTVLTSFKSQIGHTLGASGVISLIRGILALKAKVLPATLNYKTPDPNIDLESRGFLVLDEPVDWKLSNGRPRRLEVNAFGFGGSNYVVQVEEANEGEGKVLVSPSEPKLKVTTKPDVTPPPDGVSFFTTEIGDRPYRLSVVAENEAKATALVQKIEPIANGGTVPAKRLRALARQGVHLGPNDGTPTPLAFMFPGQGSHYAGMSHELYQTFPAIRKTMDRIAAVADFDILQLLFHDQEEDLQKTRWQQPALFTMEYAIVRYLYSMGIRPVAMAGHSLGELTALCLAGVYSCEDGFRIVNKRAVCMDKACDMHVDPGIMMAVDAPLEFLEEEIRRRGEKIYVTNINSPHQVVLGGDTKLVTAFGEELKAQGYRRTQLRVSMAFHSPIMECIHDELEEFISTIEFHPPTIPVISNTTMKPFPDDTEEIKRIVMAHLESPVHWMQNAQTLWDDYGVRLFVEIGPRDILTNLVSDTIEGAKCIQTCLPSAESLIFRTAVAELYTQKHLDVQDCRFVSFPGQEKATKMQPVAAQTGIAVPASSARPATQIEALLQREINAFVMESFGRFLRPNFLAAIRKEIDPHFTEDRLDDLLRSVFPAAAAQPMIPAESTFAPPPIAAPVKSEPVSPPAEMPKADTGDITEQVIGIVMDATGYERDEIEPEMDLREDLSIRSSRLPVIMDAMEAHFGIKVELEEFADVRTIQDVSDTVSKILAKKKKPTISSDASPGTKQQDTKEPSEESQTIKRVVFREVPCEAGPAQPVELEPTDSVAILSPQGGTGFRREVAKFIRRDYGVTPFLWSYLKDGDQSDDDEIAFDLRKVDFNTMVGEQLSGMDSMAGIVLVVDPQLEASAVTMDDCSRLLGGFFCMLKTFLESPARKFALLIHKTDKTGDTGGVLAEGVLGMFLSLAHEFSSVQFRTVRIDSETDLQAAIRGALDRSRKAVELIYRNGEAYTTEGQVQAWRFDKENGFELRPEHVVVVSGGGYGVTAHLARGLVPFGCKLALLGRTGLDPKINYRNLLTMSTNLESAVLELLRQTKPGLDDEAMDYEKANILKGLEIVRHVEDLRELGIEASYYACDVVDPEATQAAIQEITRRYGRIDGIIHGAGFLRDSLAKQMSPEDFTAVANVKFLGAWNLFKAAESAGLGFMTCLSSAAAIQGNPGQANYSAGNRMMSALMSHICSTDSSKFCKALMLPPIGGVGMAEDKEIQALMKRMKAAYVHVDELVELFLREIRLGSVKESWVMFMRSLPELTTSRLNVAEQPADSDTLRAAAVDFESNGYPMVDSIEEIDLRSGSIKVVRSFSQNKDVWLPDHKPFKFLKYPLVSAIMAVETFLETARILYPHLHILGIRNAEFIDIISCPPDVVRESVITGTSSHLGSGEIICKLSLDAREVSPSGRTVGEAESRYKADVMLGGPDTFHMEALSGFSISKQDLDTRPMDGEEALNWYTERTDLHGRYRLMKELDGSGPGMVRGRAQCAKTDDFAPPLLTNYQYSPYILEAVMHVANFYVRMRDQDETRSMIPYRIGEAAFLRKCRDGELFTVEARLTKQDEEGLTWNARAVDEDGEPILMVRNMVMRWFST